MRPTLQLLVGAGLVLALGIYGCGGETRTGKTREVVVYAALDREFSEPILADFEKKTGIKVLPKYDVESTKTVGLTNAILAEAARPRCDVFWNNEILNTLRLQEAGLLENYKSSAGEPYPAMFRDADGAWHGFAGRARVLIVNKDLVPEAERPTSIEDLVDPKWKGKIGIAKRQLRHDRKSVVAYRQSNHNFGNLIRGFLAGAVHADQVAAASSRYPCRRCRAGR